MSDVRQFPNRETKGASIPTTVAAGARLSADNAHDVGALEALALRLANGIDSSDDAEDLDRLSRRFMEVARMLGWGPQGVSADDRRPVAVLTDLGGPSLRKPS